MVLIKKKILMTPFTNLSKKKCVTEIIGNLIKIKNDVRLIFGNNK